MNLIPSTAQRRRWFEIVKREGTPSCVPAIFHFPYGERLSQEPHDTVLVRALLHFLQMCTSRRQPVRLATAVPSFFSWPPLRLKTPRFRWFLTGTLRKWNPRPACGTAFSSVHNISSVFGFVPTRDEPAECLPWTRRTGVCLSLPCSGEVGVRSGQQVA